MEDKLQQIEVTAQKIYGRPYSMLTEKEKEALATAFGARRQDLDDLFDLGYSMMPQGDAEMLKTGKLSHANWGGALANAARAGAGAYGMSKARQGRRELAGKEEVARNAARDVAMNSSGQYLKALGDMVRGGSQPAPQQPAPQPAAAPAPQAPAPQQPQLQGPQGPQPPMRPLVQPPTPFGEAGMPIQKQVNQEMSSLMQGQGGTMNNPAAQANNPGINAYEELFPGFASGKYRPPENAEEKRRRKNAEMAMRMRGW